MAEFRNHLEERNTHTNSDSIVIDLSLDTKSSPMTENLNKNQLCLYEASSQHQPGLIPQQQLSVCVGACECVCIFAGSHVGEIVHVCACALYECVCMWVWVCAFTHASMCGGVCMCVKACIVWVCMQVCEHVCEYVWYVKRTSRWNSIKVHNFMINLEWKMKIHTNYFWQLWSGSSII